MISISVNDNNLGASKLTNKYQKITTNMVNKIFVKALINSTEFVSGLEPVAKEKLT